LTQGITSAINDTIVRTKLFRHANRRNSVVELYFSWWTARSFAALDAHEIFAEFGQLVVLVFDFAGRSRTKAFAGNHLFAWIFTLHWAKPLMTPVYVHSL
jgi:hypothetical protein